MLNAAYYSLTPLVKPTTYFMIDGYGRLSPNQNSTLLVLAPPNLAPNQSQPLQGLPSNYQSQYSLPSTNTFAKFLETVSITDDYGNSYVYLGMPDDALKGVYLGLSAIGLRNSGITSQDINPDNTPYLGTNTPWQLLAILILI